MSLNNDPGWDQYFPYNRGKMRCHAHYYVYESVPNYTDRKWVKKGRLFQENWVPFYVLQDKWVKVRLSTNSHGTIFNADGSKCQILVGIGTPGIPQPDLDPSLP